jgi:hypothetical protein
MSNYSYNIVSFGSMFGDIGCLRQVPLLSRAAVRSLPPYYYTKDFVVPY